MRLRGYGEFPFGNSERGGDPSDEYGKESLAPEQFVQPAEGLAQVPATRDQMAQGPPVDAAPIHVLVDQGEDGVFVIS
ncbi:MAG: hypothetical protein KDM91_16730 [Verrucomicrobiae bacterium]|nr:hypothetical protein [Verrucomicrobiae bacterium]MCP5550524.1 hypothetical protein [Akkermansiaceae bacterium]